MIDPRTSLAFAIHSGPGIYALLLGSGLSRSAEIPTGWELTLDLIRKVAATEAEDAGTNPADWFQKRFGKEPDYSELLASLAPTAAERQQLLRSYFEPTSEEREQGVKVPTAAHRGIAQLVDSGYVRVIVTTNFDRLLEQALEETGVTPTVISTEDAAVGAVPLIHNACTIIKVHGDYLDTRIRNTSDELESYPNQIDELLDRVFDEFGLIVSGWSGRWDPALRGALERCKSHRFTTYWTGRGELDDDAKKLLDIRRAQFIDIEDADTFFVALEERVSALEEYAQPHPLSGSLAVAAAKRYLVDEAHRIRLHDLLMEEADRAQATLAQADLDVQRGFDEDELKRRIEAYEAATAVLRDLLITGGRWGTRDHHELWGTILERMTALESTGGKVVWLKLRLYPGTILLYACGIAALVSRDFELLKKLLLDTRVREQYKDDRPAVVALNAPWLVEQGVGQRLPDMERKHTPLSNWLHQRLRDPLKPILADEESYARYFDWFEYLVGLVYADLMQREYKDALHGPVGRFGWSWGRLATNGMPEEINSMMAESQEDLLKSGFFESSAERLKESREKYDVFWPGVYGW